MKHHVGSIVMTYILCVYKEARTKEENDKKMPMKSPHNLDNEGKC